MKDSLKQGARPHDPGGPEVQALVTGEPEMLRQLQAAGWRVHRHADTRALCQRLGTGSAADAASAASAAEAADSCGPAVVLLMADLAANCRAAERIRALTLNVRLLAVLRHQGDHEQAALLLAGADWFLQPHDRPARLAVLLRSLKQGQQRLAAPQPVHSIGPWQLQDHAWRLQHETGAVMRLTVSERAVALCLFEAPGHVATHAMLQAALQQAWQAPSGSQGARDPGLGGVVGRLRQKARQAGLSLPVGCLRGYGYLWKI